MPGCSILEIAYNKDGSLNEIYWSLGDCTRTINLEFQVNDFSVKAKGYVLNKKLANSSLEKAKIIRDSAQKIIDTIENELTKISDSKGST